MNINRKKLLLSLGIILSLIVIRLLGGLERLELSLFDLYFKLKPTEATEQRIILVGITEKDINKLKTNRLSDWQLYKILKLLEQGKPAAVGIDIFRDHPVPPNYWEIQELKEQGIDALSSSPFGHSEFLRIFKDNPNFFAVAKLTGIPGDKDFDLIQPPPLPSEQITDISIELDPDGVQRRAFLYPVTKPPAVKSLSWALAEQYLLSQGIVAKGHEKNHDLHLVLNNSIFWRFRNYSGAYVTIDDADYQILINWRKANFEVIPVSDLLDLKIVPKHFNNRIVIIGAYAPSLNDQFLTPLSQEFNDVPRQLYGIEVIGQVTSQILSAALDRRPLIQVWSEPGISLWIGFWGMGAYFLVHCFGLSRQGLIVISLGILHLVFLMISYKLFLQGLWIPVLPALLVLELVSLVNLLIEYETKRKKDYQEIIVLNQRLKQQLSKQRIYKELAILGNYLNEELSQPIQYLVNAQTMAHKEELQLQVLIAQAPKSLQTQLRLSLEKLMSSFYYQEEQLEAMCLILAKRVPNLEGLLQNIDKLLVSNLINAHPVSALSLDFLIDKLIQLTRSIIYECYEIDLKEVIAWQLQSRPYQFYESFPLIISLYIIIDDVLEEAILQELQLEQIFISDRWDEQGYKIQITCQRFYKFPKEDVICSVEERLKRYQGHIEYLLEEEWVIWVISLPLMF
ncbi:molecular chaperone TorD [Aphanothece hegewaldii CCALA 016]|uniref:Molecular chaperone TorD n=1 Tax=Aphanothece hegewaldii CCALA 016 TaxID=2107694 RepID=A0A2T1LRW1_9CHRO|nr:CHASE2 domain-containing protein [Aphanothece hegewaldii]PSF31752.1 molecular chaperone TorD [Aphanothece hegewaldii CCALA 016]